MGETRQQWSSRDGTVHLDITHAPSRRASRCA